jgi:hypothetical protein
MRWTANVAHVGERRNVYEVLIVISEENRPLGDLDVDRRIIFKWILKT